MGTLHGEIERKKFLNRIKILYSLAAVIIAMYHLLTSTEALFKV
jgi:hypothetical protein